MRRIMFAAVIATVAVQADAAVLYQQTVTATGGFAELDDVAPLFPPTTTFVGVSSGQIVSAYWDVFGQLAKLWWDPYGGGFDGDGNPVPALTGNEYFYAPECTSSLAAPVCSTTSIRTVLAANIFRIDFTPPADSYTCTPTYEGNTADCAFTYTFDNPDYDLVAAAPDGAVTFTFYDSNPLGGAVPEPAAWTLLLAGFGVTGAALRRVRRAVPTPPAAP